MSGRLCPPRLPGTQASLTPLLGLSEKEARIAKERELGTYKEHKVTDAPAPPRPLPLPLPFPPQGPARPRLGAVLSAPRPLQTAAPCWAVPLEAQDGWGLLGGPLAEGSAGRPGAHLSGEDERPQPALTA